MPVPDEDVVRRVLAVKDRDVLCRQAVEDAWKIIKEGYPERAWWRRKSTSRALMWEHSVNNAVAAFESDSGVRVIPHNDTASLLFDDIVFARFKKASIQLHTSNYPTLLALMFHRHDRDLFGHEGHHRVEIAHVLNQFETKLDWIGVVARERERVLWHFELRSGGAAVEPLPLPKRPAPAVDQVLRPVKPEAEETRDKERDKESE